ncbi:Hpt domain-containing protein [Nonlabens xiamenensis]|uniref:Hpt domain-containing protein n=1 Tax=Nonlabens xiamenensis TaxID=2341043 RepID=UPI000F61056C|nr:Hpt domain-containing protein [Nonlabens xiamenensis]
MKKVTYNLSKLNEISDNDPDFLRAMVTMFLTEVPKDLEHLAIAVVENDHVNVHRYAHKMKPSLEMFGLRSHNEILILEDWGKNKNTTKDIKNEFMVLHQELENILIQLKRDF